MLETLKKYWILAVPWIGRLLMPLLAGGGIGFSAGGYQWTIRAEKAVAEAREIHTQIEQTKAEILEAQDVIVEAKEDMKDLQTQMAGAVRMPSMNRKARP